MAQKIVNVPDIGPVVFQKRANTSSIRLHVQGSRVKVILPARVPYAFAQQFLQSRTRWVLDNVKPATPIADGAYIGKQHQVKLLRKDISRPSTRITEKNVVISLPNGLDEDSSEAQRVILKACERSLLNQTTELVIPRLQDLAFEHGFSIKSAKAKRLRSRWGSCDSQKNIILNSYLVQLPWVLIDYVLIHELAHTRHLNHSSDFWSTVSEILPDYKQLRKQTKAHSPHVITV